jgi:hypothetical protein
LIKAGNGNDEAFLALVDAEGAITPFKNVTSGKKQ